MLSWEHIVRQQRNTTEAIWAEGVVAQIVLCPLKLPLSPCIVRVHQILLLQLTAKGSCEKIFANDALHAKKKKKKREFQQLLFWRY